ncbi:MAG: DUF6794 domain-containing protein [Bacteroidota bacterium]
MIRILIFFFISPFGIIQGQNHCERYSDTYIPDKLEDAIDYLDCLWSEEDKEAFKAKPEEKAVASLHFGTGQSMRNDWGLWKGKNSLSRYFRTRGIFHPDDMSGIILTSFHRWLHGKDILLNEQISEYQAFWEQARQENLKKKINKRRKQKRALSEKKNTP